MCGRFYLNSEPELIARQFSLSHIPLLKPRYNIAPNQVIPVIRQQGSILEFLTWGLRPKWLKEEQNSFINARLETIQQKPAFKKAFQQRRCLVIANGYYEWKLIGKIKQPYLLTLPQQALFAFAGIWENDTCALITKPAAKELSLIHERMPVILNPQLAKAWLDPKLSIIELENLLANSLEEVKYFPVSTKVNNPKNDFAECINALQ